MDKFTLAIWGDHTETGQTFFGTYPLGQNFSFSTQINGGFGDGTFHVGHRLPYKDREIFDQMGNGHAVVFDWQGERAYEGRVDDLNSRKMGSVEIATQGYYAHGAEKLHGLIYTSPTYSHEVIDDTIALSGTGSGSTFWRQGNAGVERTDVDLGNFDFTGDVKLNDVISQFEELGYKATDLRRMNFLVYDGRLCFYLPEPTPNHYVNWYVQFGSLVNEHTSRSSMADVVNKLYALYDDPNGGPTLSTVLEDLISQAMYNQTREGVVSVGQMTPSVAAVLQALYLKNFAYRAFSTTLTVHGRVRDNGWTWQPVHRVRAGDTIAILDRDPDLVSIIHANGVSMPSESAGLILRTDYSGDGSMSLEFGKRAQSFDTVMKRLGLVSGTS